MKFLSLALTASLFTTTPSVPPASEVALEVTGTECALVDSIISTQKFKVIQADKGTFEEGDEIVLRQWKSGAYTVNGPSNTNLWVTWEWIFPGIFCFQTRGGATFYGVPSK